MNDLIPLAFSLFPDEGQLALLIPIVALAIPIVAMLLKHQKEMAITINGNNTSQRELDNLRAEVAQLRQLVNQQILATEDVRSRLAAPSSPPSMPLVGEQENRI